MIARRIPRELVERGANQALRREHAVAHVHERVGVDAPKPREVLGEVSGGLGHGLDRRDADVVAPALLTEVAEVLLAVG